LPFDLFLLSKLSDLELELTERIGPELSISNSDFDLCLRLPFLLARVSVKVQVQEEKFDFVSVLEALLKMEDDLDFLIPLRNLSQIQMKSG